MFIKILSTSLIQLFWKLITYLYETFKSIIVQKLPVKENTSHNQSRQNI